MDEREPFRCGQDKDTRAEEGPAAGGAADSGRGRSRGRMKTAFREGFKRDLADYFPFGDLETGIPIRRGGFEPSGLRDTSTVKSRGPAV